MRPAWQVDTITTQLKHLEARKADFLSLIQQIDNIINEAKTWIYGGEKIRRNFLEMCSVIESIFNVVSTKCLEINQDHQSDQVCLEQDSTASDPKDLSKAASEQKRSTAHECQKSKQSDDCMKRKRSTANSELEGCATKKKKKMVKTSLNVEDMISSNLLIDFLEHFPNELNKIQQKFECLEKDLKSNADDFTRKTESIYNKLATSDGMLSDLQLRVDNLQTSQMETTSTLKDLRDFDSTFERDLAALCLQQTSTDLNVQSFVEEFKSKSDSLIDSLSNLRDQVETLSKKCHALEGITNAQGLVKRADGFTALVPHGGIEMTFGVTVNSFTQVRLNRGNHFDPSTGTFTVPRNGVYLISVCVEKSSGQIMLHLVKQTNLRSSGTVINDVVVNDKETSACLVTVEELYKGEQLMIRSYNKGSLRKNSSFSCFQIF